MSKIETVNVKVKTEGVDEATKQFETLSTGVKKAADSAENLDAKFEDVFEGVEPLTTRLGEAEDRLYELALAGDTTSKEYQELLTKVGEYRKVQIQTDLAVDSAATTLGQKLGGALTGATSGFAAVQGVMGLVGGESEQLEKALLKVQSALAIQQGVQGIREAIPAFRQLGTTAMNALKGIKTGIAATGIGLLAVAVGAVVANFEQIKEILGVNNKSLEEQLELEKKITEEKQKQLQEMNQIVSNNQDFINRQIQIVKNEEKLKSLSIDSEKNATKIRNLTKETIGLELQNLRARLASTEELLSTQEKLQIKTEIFRKEQELLRVDEQALFDQRKKNSEAQAEADQEAIDNAKKLADIKNEERRKQLDEDRATLLEGSEFLKNANFEEVESTFNKYAAMGAISMQFYKDEKERIEANRIATLEGIQKGLGYAQQGADAIQQLGDLVFANKMSKLKKGSKEEEAAARKQFKFNKALQLSMAFIDAGKAITASLSQAPVAIGPVPNPAGIASLIFAASTSALNIGKIASQKFESPGGSVDAPSPGNIGGGAQAPSFNVVGDSGVNQLAQLQQEPVQAFVVSGDVTTAQALDRNRIENATL
tara:strand:+ start:2553 stop:4346 length:1794 start_codon:yes stop_codon:yes gene_type:complete